MKAKFIKFIFSTILVCGAFLLTSFSKNDVNNTPLKASVMPVTGAMAENGITTSIPAYYDHKLFTILFFEFPSKAEEKLLDHNPGLNFIYQSDEGLPDGPFISVIDAVPGDGMNPVWEEVQISFNPGYTPHQLYSDEEILDAAGSGEITLVHTGEVYTCPVTGKKPK